MAVPANTTQTFDIRQREMLHRAVEMITDHETPFFSSIGTHPKATNTFVEFSTEALRAANADNAAIEGDDVAPRTQAKPAVLGNYTQIFDEVVSVSDTSNEIDTIKSQKEFDRQRLNAGLAMRLDIEARMTGNYASVAGAAGTARKFASTLAWMTTGVERGASGANGGYNSGTKLVAAATNGTTRTLTEALFKSALRKSFNATPGSRSNVLCTVANKTIISGFTGIASNTNEVKGSDKVTIVGTADVYVSDVGRHAIRVSRQMSNRDVLIYSPEKWKKCYLQPFGKKELAATGHNEKEMMKVELTLVSLNQEASAAVVDLNTTA